MISKAYCLATSIAILLAIVPTIGQTAEQPPVEVKNESNKVLRNSKTQSNSDKPLRTSVQNEHFGVGFKNEEDIVQELCKKYHHCEKGNSIPGHRFRLTHYLSNLAEAKSTSGTSFPLPEMADRDLLRLKRTPTYPESVYERLKRGRSGAGKLDYGIRYSDFDRGVPRDAGDAGNGQVGDFDRNTEHQRIKDSLFERSTP